MLESDDDDDAEVPIRVWCNDDDDECEIRVGAWKSVSVQSNIARNDAPIIELMS